MLTFDNGGGGGGALMTVSKSYLKKCLVPHNNKFCGINLICPNEDNEIS